MRGGWSSRLLSLLLGVCASHSQSSGPLSGVVKLASRTEELKLQGNGTVGRKEPAPCLVSLQRRGQRCEEAGSVSVDRRNQPAGRRWFDVFAKKIKEKCTKPNRGPCSSSAAAPVGCPRAMRPVFLAFRDASNKQHITDGQKRKRNSSLQADRQYSKHCSFLGSASPCPR
jgi:hypothetical protein